MKLIFDKQNQLIHIGINIPSSYEGDEYIIAELPEDEQFNPQYSYTLIDGIAVKGNLIDVNNTEINRIVAEQEAIKYQKDRASEYPSIGNQLDMLWHAMNNGEIPKANTFFDAIETVKTSFPKPE